MREDQHAHGGQIRVAADVIAMDMRIDQEADFLVGDFPYSRDDLVRHRCEQRIHEQNAFRSDKGADIAATARPLNHVDVSSHVFDGKFGIRETHLGVCELARKRHEACENQGGQKLARMDHFVISSCRESRIRLHST